MLIIFTSHIQSTRFTRDRQNYTRYIERPYYLQFVTTKIKFRKLWYSEWKKRSVPESKRLKTVTLYRMRVRGFRSASNYPRTDEMNGSRLFDGNFRGPKTNGFARTTRIAPRIRVFHYAKCSFRNLFTCAHSTPVLRWAAGRVFPLPPILFCPLLADRGEFACPLFIIAAVLH